MQVSDITPVRNDVSASVRNIYFSTLRKKKIRYISKLVQISMDSYFIVSDAGSSWMKKEGRLTDKFLPFQLSQCLLASIT